MKSVLLTAGPAWEPIDEVRRLTNMSTGALGAHLAAAFHQAGWQVTLLWAESASAPPPDAVERKVFSSSSSLRDALEAESVRRYDAVLHLAAVSDFRVAGASSPGKISSRSGPLTLTLEPAPKLIGHLRDWFPDAFRVGWKYEVESDRQAALAAAERQLQESATQACVLNGPAYGAGFCWVEREQAPQHLGDRDALRDCLLTRLT